MRDPRLEQYAAMLDGAICRSLTWHEIDRHGQRSTANGQRLLGHSPSAEKKLFTEIVEKFVEMIAHPCVPPYESAHSSGLHHDGAKRTLY